MKILILSSKPPWPPHDGGAVAIMRCIEGLSAGGATVSLLTMITDKHLSHGSSVMPPPIPLHHYETVYVDTTIKPEKLISNLLFSDQPYDMIRFRSEKFSEALTRIISDGSYDIIQCEGLLFTYYADLIKSLTKAPVILRAHNVEHRIKAMSARNSRNPLFKFYLGILAERIRKRELFAISQFDGIIPISEPDFHWFIEKASGKPVLLSETGVAERLSPPGDARPEGRIGFIGALNWKPNVSGLRWFIKKVWPSVLKEMPGARLHVAGRGADNSVLRMLRHKNITWEGEIDDSESFMRSLSLLVVPLFAGSGLRIKILEAMSTGTVVVASPIAAEGLPARNGREIIIATDPASFRDAVLKAAVNSDLRQEITESALAMVRHRYNNAANTGTILNFYRHILYGS